MTKISGICGPSEKELTGLSIQYSLEKSVGLQFCWKKSSLKKGESDPWNLSKSNIWASLVYQDSNAAKILLN